MTNNPSKDHWIPNGWSQQKNGRAKKGHQANVCFVHDNNGRNGVLKSLPKGANDTAKKRFRREIGILRDTINHPNIVKILAYPSSPDEFWFISERHTPFEKYWNDFKEQHKNKPKILAEKAIQHIKRLSAALAECHEQGLIHRDIKPDNLVYIPKADDVALIDFGIAFREEEESITPISDAVGNNRCSPDTARYHDDAPNSYIDVFQLAQVLIWMLEEKPQKGWARPIDWKYVKLQEGLSTDVKTPIVAFLASCSSPEIGPQSGSDLITLLENLFPDDKSRKRAEDSFNGFTLWNHEQRRQAFCQRLINTATKEEKNSAALHIAQAFYENFRPRLLKLLGDFGDQTEYELKSITRSKPTSRTSHEKLALHRKFIVSEEADIVAIASLRCYEFDGHTIFGTNENDQKIATKLPGNEALPIYFTLDWIFTSNPGENYSGGSWRSGTYMKILLQKNSNIFWYLADTKIEQMGTIDVLLDAISSMITDQQYWLSIYKKIEQPD